MGLPIASSGVFLMSASSIKMFWLKARCSRQKCGEWDTRRTNERWTTLRSFIFYLKAIAPVKGNVHLRSNHVDSSELRSTYPARSSLPNDLARGLSLQAAETK